LALRKVRITAVRCIAEAELAFHPERTYLYGANGAGKTSILESIYLLGRGRSFRTREIRRLVRRGNAGFGVFAEVEQAGGVRRLGVGYAEGALEKRIDGDSTVGIAALAAVLPVHVIDPGGHRLIESGPVERRRFLDWGVFHVEPDYLEAWRRYRRVLGQRNAALKAGAADIQSWTAALVEAGAAVHTRRAEYVERLAAAVRAVSSRVIDGGVEIAYRRGWPARHSFEEALEAEALARVGDRVTGVGPHRADLEITIAENRVRDQASRGQQKLIAAALVLGQVEVLAGQRAERGVLLVDDPASELDRETLAKLLAALEATPAQLVLTGLTLAQLHPARNASVFHVERGQAIAL
jgi:DNA replication and repair protein RecF